MLDHSVRVARQELVAPEAAADAVDRVGVSLKGVNAVAAAHVPGGHGFVGRGRQQQIGVGDECRRIDGVDMATEGVAHAQGLQVL